MNSLVYEWLDKLGLAEVAPTFEAAGIVAPKHLATLDVSYFESLGVTSSEHRRKLFYLCQRIKLAMEKSGRSFGDDTEECVDAVISESLMARKETTGEVNDEGSVEEEKKTDVKASVAFESFNSLERRRSKRLALKTQEETEQEIPAARVPVKVRASVRRASVISANTTSKGISTAPVPATATASRTTSPVKSPVKQRSTAGSGPSKNIENSITRTTTPTKNVFNLDLEDESQPDQQRILSHSLKKEAPEEEHIHQQMAATTERPHQNPRRRGATSSKLPGSLRTGKNLSAIPSESTAPSSPLVEFSSSDLNEEMKKAEAVTRKKDFVSKLSRTKTASRSKRRTTLAAGNNDELEELLQSSTSESSMGGKLDSVLADVSDSDNESSFSAGRPQIPKLNKSRSAKSMSASDTSHLKHHQAKLPNNRRTSTLANISVRSNLDRRQSSAVLSRSDSTSVQSSAASSGAIVQGMSEVTSWAAQIQNLREENDDEYELFRDQMNSEEQEYFDMRIKVIVRKRPMSKSESSCGLDIIHPLDYSDFGKILVYQPKTRVDLTKEVETVPFAYDNVYDENSTNIQIYERSIRNLVRPFFDGQWATCFAYGQTGSG
jgi:Kinesin motor domain/SAM domain (Sterile alpha motif)